MISAKGMEIPNQDSPSLQDMITLIMSSLPENIKLAIGEDNKVAMPQITVIPIEQRRIHLLESLENNPSITASELSKIIGIPKRTIDRDIAWLREKGYLERKDSDRKGTWIVIRELKKNECYPYE